MIKDQFGKGIKVGLRSDNRFKFTHGPMLQYYVKNSMVHQTRTSKQNGEVELRYQHVPNVTNVL